MTKNTKKTVKAPQKKCACAGKKSVKTVTPVKTKTLKTPGTSSAKKGSKRCACKVTTKATTAKKIPVCNKKGQSCTHGQVKKSK